MSFTNICLIIFKYLTFHKISENSIYYFCKPVKTIGENLQYFLPVTNNCVLDFLLEDPLVVETLLRSHSLVWVYYKAALDKVIAFLSKFLKICVHIFQVASPDSSEQLS